MTNREFTATRTMLANGMATAGAELLEYMGVGAALAAIPNTEPPKYVVAGTLQMIAKILPGLESTAVSPAAAGMGDALQYLKNVAADAVQMLSHDWPKTAELLKGAVADVERLFGACAEAPAEFSERDIPTDAPRAFAKRYSELLEENRKLKAQVGAHAGVEAAGLTLDNLHNDIMNLPCKWTRSCFANERDLQHYKEGHRDARHTAADLVLEFTDKLTALTKQSIQPPAPGGRSPELRRRLRGHGKRLRRGAA